MEPLPVLLSIPHGGTAVLPELRDRVRLDRYGIHDDIDPFVREIYDLGDRVQEVVSTDVARTFVDLNRAPDDVPPANPDGVVKSTTCVGQPIYRPNRAPDARLTEALIAEYYTPYHARLRRAVRTPRLVLALDCHSMMATGPEIAPDTGRPRPLLCVGNLRGAACATATAERFAACLCTAFSLASHEVTLNQPFAGGHITRTYGGNPLPWLQIEMNRALYLADPWFVRRTLMVQPARLQELNRKFAHAVALFFDAA